MKGTTNLLDLIKQLATNHPNQIAYQFLNNKNHYITLSYDELYKKSTAIAATLQHHSSYQERAVLLLTPGFDYITAFFGCLYAGVIAVPAYPLRKNKYHAQRLSRIIENAQAKFIITTGVGNGETLDLFDNLTNNALPAKTFTLPYFINLDSSEINSADNYRAINFKDDDIAFLQYTSGSTSHPKGTMISHGNIMANLQLLKDHFGDNCRCVCSWLPPYHDMGLIGGIFFPLYFQAKGILMASSHFLQSPLRWLEIISQEKVTHTGAPNFAYDLCSNKATAEDIAQLDLSHWRYCINGAEPIRQKTLQRFFTTFAPAGLSSQTLFPCYGLAEATLILTGKKFIEAPSSVTLVKSEFHKGFATIVNETSHTQSIEITNCGHTLPPYQINIVDPNTCTSLPEQHIGEIWASGPSIAKGYWNNPDTTQTTFAAKLIDKPHTHYLRTGDLGFIYKGDLYITGRSKDLIIINGVNYYPQDIEQTITDSHSDLQTHGVAAFIIDSEEEEQLIILQEIKRERMRQFDADTIFNTIHASLLSDHGITAQKILLLKPYTLAKTSSGKIQRWACKEALTNNTLQIMAEWNKTYATQPGNETIITPQHGFSSVNEATEWLIKWLQQHLHQFNDPLPNNDTNLLELGISSLTAAELINDLYHRLSKRFDIATILEQKTISDLAKFLIQQNNVIQDSLHQQNQQLSMQNKKHTALSNSLNHPHLPILKQLFLQVNDGISSNTSMIGDTKYINFSGYNYLGLSGNPTINEFVIAAIKEYGTSVSASRLASGEKLIHKQLENSIANLIGVEDCAILPSGYATNIAIITHLFGPGDLIIYDNLAHNSILQGSLFSGATCMTFPHNNYAALTTLLETYRDQYQRVLIVSEGVFSMDGDICNAPKLITIKKQFATFIMLDEAHSMGTIGATGRGISEFYQLNPEDIDIWMGTLSKAFASCGGYIAGKKQLIENFKYTAAGFVYSAGISPANTAAAFAAIEMMKQQPQRVTTLQHRHNLLLSLLTENNIPTGLSANTPIIPIIVGDTEVAIKLSLYLKEHGIYALPIFYPAVAKDAARIRLFVNSLHEEVQIYQTVKIIKDAYQLITTEKLKRHVTCP